MIDVGWLAETGPCKMFKAGQSIPCPGSSDVSEHAMYIMIVGRVDVYTTGAKGSAELVGTLLPGDVFGGREFFTGAAENVYAAVADSVVYVLSENSFNDLSWAQPEILFEVLRAAYTPPRKIEQAKAEKGKTAPEAAAKQKASGNTKPAQEPKAEPLSKEAAKPKAAEKAKPAPEMKTEKQPKTGETVGDGAALTELPVSLIADYSIFPEGHKYYPVIAKPEYTRLVYPKDYSCPFCKKDFMDNKVFRSKLYEAAPVRYDLRRFYTDFQTEWYDVITCRHCYFSTLHNYFTEPKPMQKAKIENELTAVRASILLDFDADRDVNFVFTTHYLAILCAGGYRASSGRLITSKLWGNLSWLYEDVGDEDMMRMAADKAAEEYEAIYKETRLTPAQEQITCLSIAGMQFRAGVDRNLKKFLFTAKTIKEGEQTYAKLAEDFLYEIRAAEENG